MASLVFAIESEFSENYLVFGQYSPHAEFECHRFPISGFECGFVPSLRIRSSFLESSKQMSREWVAEGVIHRSGLRLQNESRNLDFAVLHPKTVGDDLKIFAGSKKSQRAGVARKVKEFFRGHTLDSVA